MSMSTRRVLWYVVLPLFLLTTGLLIFWAVHWIELQRLEKVELETLEKVTQLASVPVAEEPGSLAWSADGRYLAAGTGRTFGGKGPRKVFIVDIGKEAIAATLETAGSVTSLAFSPDGKWLAVATQNRGDKEENDQNELIVFTIPDFTAKLTAKATSTGWGNFFVDLAWRPDSKSVNAIDSHTIATDKSAIRRWTIPGFVEQPAISLQNKPYKAIAVAPDGVTVATVEHVGFSGVVRLFNLEKGTEIRSIEKVPMGSIEKAPMGYYRVGFTPDGKTVGVFSGDVLPFDPDGKKHTPQIVSWWDVGTGKLVRPAEARFAIQPAGQTELRFYSITPDTNTWARSARSAWGVPQVTINFTRTDPARTWTWRASELVANGALAFSPDGTKLAGTLKKMPDNWTIAIWAVP